jgi:hypothetical protein
MRYGKAFPVCLAGLLLGLTMGAAQAQFGPEDDTHFQGVIVSVRADIVQVRPRYRTKLTRLVLDDKTKITNSVMLSPEKLQPGMNVISFGDYDDKGGLKPNVLMFPEELTGFFGAKTHGVEAIGYGKSAMLSGKLKSVKPFVVTDSFGKDFTLTLGGFTPMLQMARAGREVLLVGKMIFVEGEKTNEGLLRAERIELRPPFGGAGALFGEIVTVNDKTLEVRPRFAGDTLPVTLADNITLLRQITLDPDTIKVGDTLTIQGRLTEGTETAPSALTAFVLLTDASSYPASGGGGGFFGMGGGGKEVKLTGKIASFRPFLLALPDGKTVKVTIPGQTPVVSLKPIPFADLKPGEKAMLLGSEGQEGGLTATTLVLDASPIVGFGN